MFCFVNDHLNNFTLTFCTSHIKACCVTDTAIRCCLYTVQMITVLDFFLIFRFFRKFNWCVAESCILGCLYTVVIHMHDFRIGHIHIKTAQIINDRCKCIEFNSSIICNIQIQVGIQHGDCLFRTAICICSIRFGIGIIAKVQKCITINRYKFYLFGIIVDTRDDHGITVLVTGKLHICASGINSEQSIGRITGQM